MSAAFPFSMTQSPEALLAEGAMAKEAEALRVHRRTDLYLQASLVAFRALYEAAAAGNTTCRAAVREIDKLIPSQVQTHAPAPTHPAPTVPPSADAVPASTAQEAKLVQ